MVEKKKKKNYGRLRFFPGRQLSTIYRLPGIIYSVWDIILQERVVKSKTMHQCRTPRYQKRKDVHTHTHTETRD